MFRLSLAGFTAGLFVALATTTGLSQAQFRSSIDRVVVDVLVTDRGMPVVGLGPEDFRVKDNGVTQNVSLFRTRGDLNLVIVLDRSGSVAGEPWTNLRAGVETLLLKRLPGDRLSIVSFSQDITLLPIDGELPVGFEPNLTGTAVTGRTSLYDAVFAGVMEATRTLDQAVMVVFSDGLDNASWLSADAVIDSVAHADVTVYSVSAAPALGRGLGFLQRLAERSGGRVAVASRESTLSATLSRLVDEARARYILSYTPTGVARGNGWHSIDVKVTGKGTVTAKRGYYSSQ
jgi:VWFA-related protein